MEQEILEANPRGWQIVAYEQTGLGYGGPEEGGWWYDTGRFARVIGIVRGTREQASAKCYRLNEWMRRLQKRMRPVSSMAYSGGRYTLSVYPVDEAPAQSYPAERPHYE